MGTLRDEMSKVLNEWDKQDQQVETTSQPSQEKTMEKRVTTTQKLINLIAANPGITSKDLYKLVEEKHQDIPVGNVSSTLTQLTGRYVLSREASGEIVHGKTIYAYSVIPEAKGKAMREEAERKLKEAQARMEKARQVKAAKQAAREQLDKMLAEREQQEGEERTGLSDLLPRATTAIHNTKPTWSAKEVLEGLNVLQAQELYAELDKIFGGN
jgi:hypothetical protein